MFVTFHLVCLGWIFFRAESLADSWAIVSALATDWSMPFLDAPVLLPGALFVAVLLVVQVLQSHLGSLRERIAPLPIGLRWALWYGMVFAIVLFGTTGSQFIYFQF